MNDFESTPCPLPPDPPQWATYVGSRTPRHKLHPSLGQAKAALSYVHTTYDGFRVKCAVFEWVTDKWVERASFKRGDGKDHILWTNVRLFEAGMTGIINEAEIPGDR